MENVDTFGSALLQDVAFNDDGSLKQSGKQNVKFYNKKRLAFRARRDESGELVIDKKTGLPFKDAYDEVVEFVRIETRGDTNIFDGVANDFHKRQFYRQYKMFREGRIPDGNPIEDFEFLQSPTIMELHMLGIHTIQQVAEMRDLECEQLKDQSGYELRDIAKQWVEINSPHGQSTKAAKLELENARLRRELEDSRSPRREVQPLAASRAFEQSQEEAPIQTMEIDPNDIKKGPGRPRKVQ